MIFSKNSLICYFISEWNHFFLQPRTVEAGKNKQVKKFYQSYRVWEIGYKQTYLTYWHGIRFWRFYIHSGKN